jgi:hypothetical protein
MAPGASRIFFPLGFHVISVRRITEGEARLWMPFEVLRTHIPRLVKEDASLLSADAPNVKPERSQPSLRPKIFLGRNLGPVGVPKIQIGPQ